MKPYAGIGRQGSKERIFNYRLSRARRVVGNVFVIQCSVFRVLRRPMLLQLDTASLIVMTTVYLYNFLKQGQASREIYTPPGTFDSVVGGHLVEGS